MVGGLILEACVSASRIFHDEIRLHTMSSLLMLPRSIPYMGYSKAIGCLMGLDPRDVLPVGRFTVAANSVSSNSRRDSWIHESGQLS